MDIVLDAIIVILVGYGVVTGFKRGLIGQLFEPLGPRVALTTIEVVLVLAFGVWAILLFGTHARQAA